MEGKLKAVFKNTEFDNIQYSILDATVGFGLETIGAFDEKIKELIIESFKTMEDENTEKVISDALCNMIIAAFKAFRKENLEIIGKLIDVLNKGECFHCKENIIYIIIEYLINSAFMEDLPRGKIFNNLYDSIFDIAKTSLVNNTDTILFDQRANKKSVCKLAVLSHNFASKEDVVLFSKILYKSNGLTKTGLLFFKHNNDLYKQVVPLNNIKFKDIIKLGSDASKLIISSFPIEHIFKIFSNIAFPNENYEILLIIIKKIVSYFNENLDANIKDINTYKLGKILSKIHVDDLSEEIVAFMKRNEFELSQDIVSQITDLTKYTHIIPVMSSIEGLSNETINNFLKKCKDRDILFEFLKLNPGSEMFSTIDYWFDLYKKIGDKIIELSSLLYNSIPTIDNYLSVIIPTFGPMVSMSLLNGIIEIDSRMFVLLMRHKEYIELLKVSPILLPSNLERKIDFSSFYKNYDENTPAPLLYLLTERRITPSSFKLPHLPELTSEEIKYCINADKKDFVPRGNNLIMIKAIANLTKLIWEYNQKIDGITRNNKIVFLIFFFMSYEWITCDKEIFTGKQKTVWQLTYDFEKEMNETETQLFLILIDNIIDNLSITPPDRVYYFAHKLFILTMTEKNPLLEKGIIELMEKKSKSYNFLLEKVLSQNSEEFIKILYRNNHEPSIELWSLINSNPNKNLEFEDVGIIEFVSNLNEKYDTEAFIKKREKEHSRRRASYREDIMMMEIRYRSKRRKIDNDLIDDTIELRKDTPFSKLKEKIKSATLDDIKLTRKLVKSLLNDDLTNVNFLQFMIIKLKSSLVFSRIDRKLRKYFQKMRKPLETAIDSLYQKSPTDNKILIQRVNPTELPSPSEYSTNLVNELLDFCKEELSFNSFGILHYIASDYLPIFKYTKMSVIDIFNFCALTKYSPNERMSPFIAAMSFLNSLLFQPQFMDEFFEWTFKNMKKFDENGILMVTSIILLKLINKETTLFVVASLMKYNWMSYYKYIKERAWNDLNNIIFITIDDLTIIMVNELTKYDSNDKIVLNSLIKCNKIFYTAMGNLPYGDFYEQNTVCNLIIGSKNDEYKVFKKNVKKIKFNKFDELSNFCKTPVKDNDVLPEIVSKDLYINLNERDKITYLISLINQQQLTPELISYLAKHNHWMLNTIKNNCSYLSSSHYLKILQTIEESNHAKKENVVKFTEEITKPIIKELMENDRFISRLGLEDYVTLLKCTCNILLKEIDTDLNLIITLLNIIAKVDTKIEADNEHVLKMVNFVFKENLIEDSKVLLGLLKIITYNKTKLSYEKVEILIGLSIKKGLKHIDQTLKFYSILSQEQQEKLNYLIDDLYIKSLQSKDYKTIHILIKHSPKNALKFKSIFIQVIEILYEKSIEKNKVSKKLIEILNVLLPSNNDDNIEFTSNKDDSRILPIPESVLAQNPKCWEIVAKLMPFIIKDIEKDTNLIVTKYSFLTNYPTIIPFDLRHLIIRKTYRKKSKNNIELIFNRDSILQETFETFKPMSNDDYFKKFKVKFINENGTDLGGLTKDWLTSFTKELFDPKNKFFKQMPRKISYSPSDDSEDLIKENPETNYFEIVGKIIAAAITHNITIIAPLSKCILKRLLNQKITEEDVKSDLGDVYDNLIRIRDADNIEDLYLNFTWNVERGGKIETVELKEGGEEINVTKENVEEYIKLAVDFITYKETQQQIDSLVNGFHKIIPADDIKRFISLDELNAIINGNQEIDVDDFEKNIIIEKPCTRSSPIIKMLFNIIRRWDNEKRSKLLEFITSLPYPPIEGFKSLEIKISVSYHSLPKSSTCFNRLYLPIYEDEKNLEQKLLIAIEYCNTIENY